MIGRRAYLWTLLGVLLFSASIAYAQNDPSALKARWPAPTVAATPFATSDVQVGDPSADYYNVEIEGSYPYLIWIEKTGASDAGIAWQCGINPDTGALTPADCRGFKAFDTTIWNRPNIGVDAKGLYYVGADAAGNMYLVRPTGPTTASVTKLPTPPDPRRRGYYPSLLPGSDKDYILWVTNSNEAGGGFDTNNTWEELDYIDVSDPTNVHVIEREYKKGTSRAPLDVTFFRWVNGEPAITYGAYNANGQMQLKEYHVDTGLSEFVTSADHVLVDAYGFLSGGTEYILPGLDLGPTTGVYTRPKGTTGLFTLSEEITTPAQSKLAHPALAQSNQDIEWGSTLYSAYQVNDAGTNYTSTDSEPGEIWLSTVGQTPQKQWLLSGADALARLEPEPFVGTNAAYVFYSAAPVGSNINTVAWQLRRAATPLSSAEGASTASSSPGSQPGGGESASAPSREGPLRAFIASVIRAFQSFVHWLGQW